MATVAQVWRFPVKSMGGQQLDAATLSRRGLHADRLWAVRDLDNDITATARRIPDLLGCCARYVDEPGPAAGPGNVPPVVITFPDGSESRSGDPATDARLSELVGRPLALTPLARGARGHRLSWQQMTRGMSPDQLRADLGLGETDPLPDAAGFSVREMINLARFSTPPNSFVDIAPVHVLSTASIAYLEARHGSRLDVRRFRPNLVIDTDEPGLAEERWLHSYLAAGDARLRINTPTVRCVVPSRAQAGIEVDRELGRALSEHAGRYLGAYAGVADPGEVRVGDDVKIIAAEPPSRAELLGRRALSGAKRATMRIGQATIMR